MNPLRDWNAFWFRPRPVGHLGLFRIGLGIVALMKLALLVPILNDLFGSRGILTVASSLQDIPGPRIGFLDMMPDSALPLFFAVLLIGALCYTIGFLTRPMAVALFIGLLSVDNRNPPMLNSGDRLLSVLVFYSIFAPIEATFSVDRLIALFRGKARPGPVVDSYWAVRLMQFQICMMYFWSTYIKVHGGVWEEGTAVYWTSHNLERARFPIPFLTENMVGINFLTYFTMIVEGLFPFAVWWKRSRGYIILSTLLLHLGIEWSMNIQIFEYLAIFSLLLFFDDAEIDAALAWARQRLFHFTLVPVFYDGACVFCSRVVNVLQAMDIFHRLGFQNSLNPELVRTRPDFNPLAAEKELLVRDLRGRWYGGFYAFRWMAWRLPLAWPFLPFLYLPGVSWLGRRVYDRVASHRLSVGACSVGLPATH